MKMTREKKFLKGLTKLTKEHGVEISGCGCCGSPSLGDISFPDRCIESAQYIDDRQLELQTKCEKCKKLTHHLEHNKKRDKYVCSACSMKYYEKDNQLKCEFCGTSTNKDDAFTCKECNKLYCGSYACSYSVESEDYCSDCIGKFDAELGATVELKKIKREIDRKKFEEEIKSRPFFGGVQGRNGKWYLIPEKTQDEITEVKDDNT